MRAAAPVAAERRPSSRPGPGHSASRPSWRTAEAAKERAAPVSYVRTALLGALGLLLASQILWRSGIAYVANASPETALALRPAHAFALSRLVDTIVSSDPAAFKDNPPDLAATRKMAGLALTGEPLNTTALRVLGTIADQENDKERARAFMTAAARGSLRESLAHYWLISEGLRTSRFEDIPRHVDILMRTRPQFIAQLTPVLAAIAEKAPDDNRLAQLLATNPPWRNPFFSALPKSITDARTPLNLLHSLMATASPPTQSEINPYLRFLMQHKFYDLAYYSWLQFLTPEQLALTGYLNNGNFEGNPTGAPFDWSLFSGRGVTVNLLPRPESPQNRALYLEFGHGRIELQPIAQHVLLSPGDYVLAWQIKGQLNGRRGLVWRLSCLETGTPVAASTMMTGPFPKWTTLEVAFSVPPQGCRAQSLQLVHDSRSASEQFVSGSVWIDEVRIRRKEAAQ